MPQTTRVAITGLGVVCPVGCNTASILLAMREGRSGIGAVSLYSATHFEGPLAGQVHDAEFSDHLTKSELLSLERTERMAVAAARQAWNDAAIPVGLYKAERIALSAGASGAGLTHQSANDVFRLKFQPYQQASSIASALNLKGPIVMFSSASAGSGLAIGHAMNLLRGNHADLVIAGGAECLSEVNHQSMDGMGLCSAGACSPFSGKPGLTVGEGGAFFVLERLDDVVARSGRVRAELFSFGATQDGYDVVAGDPSGHGLARAFVGALRVGGVVSGDVGWIKANGTSNRDQDAAETLAVKEVFQPAPPVSALESFIGHANGAAPALGFGMALIAFENGLLPPTLNFTQSRAGCDLDYVPNHSRQLSASCVLASSVGFGGSNVALLFGTPHFAPLSPATDGKLCITGVGVMSSFGAGYAKFVRAIRNGESGIQPDVEMNYAGLVPDLRDKRVSGRETLLQRFALAAATEAFQSAQLSPENLRAAHVGLFVGLCRGSAAARKQYASLLENSKISKTFGKSVVQMGRFTVASALSQQFKLHGYGATISEGFGAGLHALAHACIHLENSPAEQALLVVAADETGNGPASSLREMNWLSDGLAIVGNGSAGNGSAGNDGCYLRPYNAESTGTTLAEGAVALVVERRSSAQNRGAYIRADIDGVGLSSGEGSGTLAYAIRHAMHQAGIASQEISGVYGNGSGIPIHDQAELDGLREVIPSQTPIGNVNRYVGFAESASGLFHVAAAVHGFSDGEFFPVQSRSPLQGSFERLLMTARTEGNRNAAVLLGRPT